jgi:5-methylcytosine-specific restriction endonuclease McrA
MMQTKVCKTCGGEKDITDFYKQRSGKFGVMAVCKICWKKHVKEYRDTNPEKVKERKRLERITYKKRYKDYATKYYIENKETIVPKLAAYRLTHKEEKSIRGKEYYNENKDKLKAIGCRYYSNNKDAVLIATKKYRDTHKEKISDYNKYYKTTPDGKENRSIAQIRRRTYTAGGKCTLTRKQWGVILEMQNNKCAYCNKEFTPEFKPTKDHIIPLSKGGGLTFGNVQALCGSCNSKKQANVDFLKMSILFTDEVAE